VRLRWRGAKGKQEASIPDRPARVVGTSNLSDGNVLAHAEDAFRDRRSSREPGRKPRASHADAPADVVTTRQNGGGNVLFDGPDHRPSSPDAPARTLTKNTHGDGALLANDRHPPLDPEAPASTLGARDRGGQNGVLAVHERHPVNDPDLRSYTLSASDGGGAKGGGKVMAWPWDRPATVVHSDAGGRMTDNRGHGPNAIKLSEKAAAILQGFPEGWIFSGETKKARWGMIGMAMPPPLGEAVGRSIAAQMKEPSR